MKISSYTKYLRLRVINTGVPWVVAILVVMLLMAANPAKAQNAVMKPSRTEAQAAWDRGDYEKAYNHFNGLLLLYTRDPLYQFYTGACLVNQERDIQRAVTLLSSAINSSVNIKSVPDEVWFYYGRALQMSGSFSQAIEAYDRFARQAGRKVAAGYEVQGFIDQCKAGDGALGSARTSQPAFQKEAEVKENLPVVTERQEVQKAPIKETTDASVSPDSGRPVATRTEASRSEITRTEAGRSETTRTEASRQESTRNDASRQESTRTETGRSEATRNEASRQEATRNDASRQESTRNDASRTATTIPEQGRGNFPVVRGDTSGIPAEQFRLLGEALEHQEEADSLLLAMERRGAISEEVTPLEPEPVQETGSVSLFELKDGQAYAEASPVPVEPAMPDGLIYTIQIAAFRNNVAPSLFRGLYPVFGKRRQGSDVIYYYTGLFRRLEDARHALPEARGAGFNDAFIIAMMDGTQVSMERATLLEKEWGSRTFTGAGQVSAGKTSARVNESLTEQPALAGTLSFRAEVMRITKPVKPDMIQKIETLAGTRGLDIIKNSDGETVFLIGNFITFESADDYVSLLIRNGYSEARVAAYVGMQEIPVEAARDLLKKIPDD